MNPDPSLESKTPSNCEPLFERLFEYSPDGILVADDQGRIVRANGPAERMFGYGRGELAGQSIEIVVPERFRDAHAFYRRDYIEKLRNRPGCISVESFARRCDATEFPAEIIVTPVVEGEGGPLVLAVVRDITRRKLAEDALRKSESHYRTLLQNLPQKIFLKDRNSVYISCNDNFARDLKIDPQDISGKTDFDLFPKDLAETYRAGDLRILQRGGTTETEEEYLHDGEKRVVHTVKTAVKDDTGSITGVLGIFWDITEHKRADEALRQREQQLQSILDNSPDTIFLKDLDGRYLKLNRHCAQSLGAPEEKIIGKTIFDFMPRELAEQFRSHDSEVLECGCPKQFEEALPQKDGTHTYLATKFPLLDSAGKPYAICGISADITKRKKAELELQKREQQLQSILDNSPAVIYIKDLEGRYLKVSRHCAKGLGASEEQIIGKTIHDFFPKELADLIDAHDKQVIEIRSAMQFEDVAHRDGEMRTTLAVKFPLLDSSGVPYAVGGISTDITERKKAEEAVRESEERFRQIAENIHDVFWIASSDFEKILYVSPAYEQVWGRSCESLYERPLDWIEGIHPDDREMVNRKFHDSLERCEAFDLEYRVVRPDGSIRFMRDRSFPVLDAAGKPYRFVGIATDFTERQRSREELRKREEQLHSILNNSTSPIYLKDREGRYLHVNRQFAEVFGTLPERMIGKTAYDVVSRDKGDRLKAMDTNVLKSGVPTEFEEVLPTSDGLRTFISTKFPVLDSSGQPWAVGGIMTDITERKRSESALLLEMMKVLAANLEPQKLLAAVSASIGQVVEHDYATLALYDPACDCMRVHRLTTPEGGVALHEQITLPVEGSPVGYVYSTRELVVLNRMDMTFFPSQALQRAEYLRRWIGLGVNSVCWLPLLHSGHALGVLVVASKRKQAFQEKELRLLTEVANQIAVALDNALAFRQITESMDRLEQEKLYLEDELKTEYNFEEIVGESTALKRVLKTVETVAPTEATVLILGETGTGKELIARAIHNLSPRRGHTFVKLNCAAIPAGLLESELFGHEKGAFTGAIARKIGRLEVATGGTLLLDEVGDIPLELQPKLLRALQEKEFERVGSTRTIPADVRIIAATNRDLAQMVEDGRFRRDLFYRLSVIPVTIPPLRERKEDIPVLLHYFLQKHSQRTGRNIKRVSPGVMQALVNWRWPGNVREMENLIERAVILSTGTELRVPLGELRTEADGGDGAGSPPATPGGKLDDVEREHILQVLRETKGVIGGPGGAAVRLGLKRTTLNFKLRKLGITREDF